MGGVQIKNCTAVPLRIQLWQVSCLYHGHVQPGEYFTRNTGAVHFTIKASVNHKDDTPWTQTVLPIVTVVGTTLAAMATAGVGAIAGAAVGTGLFVPSVVAADGLVGAAAVATEAGLIAATGTMLTKELAIKLFSEAKPEHLYISSSWWYFGGTNNLEIHGGPKSLANDEGFRYDGSPLRIVDANNPNRYSS